MSKPTKESTAGGSLMGFTLPLQLKDKEKEIKEFLQLNPDITLREFCAFSNVLGNTDLNAVSRFLSENNYVVVREAISSFIVETLRMSIKGKVQELVRKKGDKFVLYAPNRGKKGTPKAVGEFGSKTMAKKAELERFPPTDGTRLKKRRQEIDKLLKDPKKMKEKERAWAQAGKKRKHEGLEVLRNLVTKAVNEGLFREEKSESQWNDYLSQLSQQVLASDKKFQNLQKNIKRKTEDVLEDAFAVISRAVKKKFKTKNFGVKQDGDRVYLAFSVMGDVNIEPIYIYVHAGVPKIELSDQARVSITKLDPADAKFLRAEIVTVQESVLDDSDVLAKAIESRDKYLEKLEIEVDKMVVGLSPLQISLLKKLLVKKYRKI